MSQDDTRCLAFVMSMAGSGSRMRIPTGAVSLGPPAAKNVLGP